METVKVAVDYQPAKVNGQAQSGGLKRKLKTQGKRVLRQIFELGQKFGLDVLPRHFYSEIPDIRYLRSEQKWREPFDMDGIRGGLDEQMKFVEDSAGLYVNRLTKGSIHQAAIERNGSDEGYGEIEADFLYCFVRRHRPAAIFQVGCGVSTAVCLLAAKEEGYKPRIVCIEPYPTDFLKQAHAAGEIELVEQKVQDLDVAFFKQLASGDLFFIDSSHTLGPGGEVSRIVLGILPKLAQGTFVHFHDIWFPYDYCPHVLSGDLFFLHETPLLYAFLCMNEHYSVAASLSQLFHDRKKGLQKAFPQMIAAEFSHGLMVKPGHHPSSIYLRA